MTENKPQGPKLYPWWGWVVSLPITAFICELNKKGYLLFSFIVAMIVIRFVVSNKGEESVPKWAAAFIFTLVSLIVYWHIAADLWPGSFYNNGED